MEDLYALIERFSKRCPTCAESQLTSDNSTPLNHRCLSCGWKGTDLEVLKPPKGGWKPEHRRERLFHRCRMAQEFARIFTRSEPLRLAAELAKLHTGCPKRLVVHNAGVVFVCNCPCHTKAADVAGKATE